MVVDFEPLNLPACRALDPFAGIPGRKRLLAPLTDSVVIRDGEGLPLFALSPSDDQNGQADPLPLALFEVTVATLGHDEAPETVDRHKTEAEAHAREVMNTCPPSMGMPGFRGEDVAHWRQLHGELRWSWGASPEEIERWTGRRFVETRGLWPVLGAVRELDAKKAAEQVDRERSERQFAAVEKERVRLKSPGELGVYALRILYPLDQPKIMGVPEREPLPDDGLGAVRRDKVARIVCVPKIAGLEPTFDRPDVKLLDEDEPTFTAEEVARIPREPTRDHYRFLLRFCRDRGRISSWPDPRGEEIAFEALAAVGDLLQKPPSTITGWRIMHAFDAALAHARPDLVAEMAYELTYVTETKRLTRYGIQSGPPEPERYVETREHRGYSRKNCEDAALAALERGYVRPGSLLPPQAEEEMKGPDPWIPIVAAALLNQEEITSDELVRALADEGQTVNPRDPRLHSRIFRIMAANGWPKKVLTRDGQKYHAFVRRAATAA